MKLSKKQRIELNAIKLKQLGQRIMSETERNAPGGVGLVYVGDRAPACVPERQPEKTPA